MRRQITVGIFSCVAALNLLGCAEPIPAKGTGASGHAKAEDVKSDKEGLGLSLVNKLDQRQEMANSYLHQPAAKAVLPTKLPDNDPNLAKQKAILERWDSIKFTDVKADRVLRPTLTVVTSEGEFMIQLIYDIAPNHSRGLIAAAREDWYTDTVVTLVDGKMTIGKASEKPFIHLQPEIVNSAIDVSQMPILATTDATNKSILESFQIKCDSKPMRPGVYTVVGIIPPVERRKFERVMKAVIANPGKVKVVTVRTLFVDQPLFDGAKVTLPDLGKDGKPIVPNAGPPIEEEPTPPPSAQKPAQK